MMSFKKFNDLAHEHHHMTTLIAISIPEHLPEIGTLHYGLETTAATSFDIATGFAA